LKININSPSKQYSTEITLTYLRKQTTLKQLILSRIDDSNLTQDKMDLLHFLHAKTYLEH